MIWEAIQRAKPGKLILDVVWLDLANAYGSVPHEMIQLALRMYHVPEVIQVMLDDYLSGFRMRFSTNNYTTNWINLEVGIAMGCTISPILFVMAMEVILKAAEGSAGPANLGGGCSMPPLKAFMDNTTIICSKEDETRRMLTRLDDLMSWCRMEFKPKKSRSLSIRRGKVDEATTFTVAEQKIPTVSQEPVKSLGRWYDFSLKDNRRGAEKLELASESLLAINKCGLQGKFKIWCLQFMLIPKLLWPLLVYDICSSTVEAIEAKINKYTRKWLGVPPGLSDVAMYCRKAKLKLPMKSILEEYKCVKARLLTMLEESDDPVVKTVQPSLKTGRKWKVTEAVDEAKECLKMKEVIGQTQTDRRGLGSTTAKWWSKTEGKEKRDMIIDEIRNKEDSTRVQKAVQQPQQGQWTNWDTAIQRSLTWNDIWHMAPLRISFLIRSVYDLLPSNANLVRCGKKDDPTCPLCQGRQTAVHVLSLGLGLRVK
ncbi:reverse transcriptase [Plakobranchus ocellatus]|uniref:Reverse transcriptase n=1 Tax=Plakobranchus ocellatus TaxID=259542 RepID=A0AAV3XVV9_9GAST|nr:reverse transcriptase [Plakobranchus ocellatus]